MNKIRFISILIVFLVVSIGAQAKSTTLLPGFGILHFQKVNGVCDFDVLPAGFKSNDVKHVFLNKVQQKFVVSALDNTLHIQQKNCKLGKNEVGLVLKNDTVLLKSVALEPQMQKSVVTWIMKKFVGGVLKKFICYSDIFCVPSAY